MKGHETIPLDEQLAAWQAAAPGFVRRQLKTAQQVRYGWSHPRRVSFVFGCQRSGTKMLMRVLDKSPSTRIFHENHRSAFRDFQLRSDATVRALIRLNPAPSQIFKPICDSQEADRILDRFDQARGLWLYRHYDDVANSADLKWGTHQRDLVNAVVDGDLDRWGWRTARLSAGSIADLRSVWRPDLTPAEGALLFWYLRNRFFFDLGLDRHPRMLLVRYEDLVLDPQIAFAPVFAQVGAPFDPLLLDDVRAGSVGRRPPPRASRPIRALCDDLLARLDAHCQDQGQGQGHPVAEPGMVSPLLVLNNTLEVGGAERYIVTVANWLADHDVRVAVAAQHGALAGDLDSRIRFHDTPLNNVRSQLPLAAMRVRRILRDEQPAAIIANSLVAAWVARLAQGRRRVPIIEVAHGWPAERYGQVGRLIRVADKVVAVSPEVKRKLVAGGMDADRCEVVFNGVDCAPFGPREGPLRTAARQAMGAGDDHIVVVNVGRLSAQKAHHHFVTVASILREIHPLLRFAIVGGGERREELQALIDAAELQDVVRLLGQRSDVADLLGSAELYLSSSDWEGMPLSTIEAMASGLPCVATRTEGTDQLLTRACGIVVPVADTDAMAAAIDTLAADAGLRQRMAVAARRRALAEFTHDRMAQELAAVVGRVVVEHRR